MISGKSVLPNSINNIFRSLQGTITYLISLAFHVSNQKMLLILKTASNVSNGFCRYMTKLSFIIFMEINCRL